MAGQKNSLYKDAYCNEVIACLSEGHSLHGFAGLIGVGRRTVFDWMDRYPEFRSACDVAAAKAVYYWEGKLRECANAGKGKYDVTAIIFALKNRAHEDWRDVHKVEVGKPGEFSAMSDEELNDFISRSAGEISASVGREEEAGGKKGPRSARRLN